MGGAVFSARDGGGQGWHPLTTARLSPLRVTPLSGLFLAGLGTALSLSVSLCWTYTRKPSAPGTDCHVPHWIIGAAGPRNRCSPNASPTREDDLVRISPGSWTFCRRLRVGGGAGTQCHGAEHERALSGCGCQINVGGILFFRSHVIRCGVGCPGRVRDEGSFNQAGGLLGEHPLPVATTRLQRLRAEEHPGGMWP